MGPLLLVDAELPAHRAAIGLAEQTDAIVVVVSEETGDLSLCYNGKLLRDLDLNQFSEKLKSNFKHRKNK